MQIAFERGSLVRVGAVLERLLVDVVGARDRDRFDPSRVAIHGRGDAEGLHLPGDARRVVVNEQNRNHPWSFLRLRTSIRHVGARSEAELEHSAPGVS